MHSSKMAYIASTSLTAKLHRIEGKFLRRNLLLLWMISFALLTGVLSPNTIADPLPTIDGNGSLRIQVMAGVPGSFNDGSLADGKYPASDATISIYRQDPDFSFEGYTDKQGQLIVSDLPIGPNKYEIVWWDFRGDRWIGKGSVYIKKSEMLAELVDLKRDYGTAGTVE